ncbi:MAG: signal peptidase I [Ruminococcus sp.]|nr:signal peptidase I [Ruminococcus sp.]
MKEQSSISISSIFKIIGKIISWALFAVLLVAAAFLLYYYVATKNYALKGPGHEPKFSIYTIISGSMEPNIHVYDAVINIKADTPSDIKVGDVITFISTSVLTPGTTITHRVIGITRDDDGSVCYQTKGDWNKVPDQACAKFHNIIGKVVLTIPQLGRVQLFLAKQGGWIICILIPALIIIVRDVLRITKLVGIKDSANKMAVKSYKDPEKERLESVRKDELKRKLITKETTRRNVTIYYEDPEIITIEKGNNFKKKL